MVLECTTHTIRGEKGSSVCPAMDPASNIISVLPSAPTISLLNGYSNKTIPEIAILRSVLLDESLNNKRILQISLYSTSFKSH